MTTKIIDAINQRLEEGKTWFSFEYFPPKTPAGVANLYDRIDRLAATGPLFIDVTWGAGGSTSDLTTEICETSQNTIGIETQMHMTCTNQTSDTILKALTEAKKRGIRNILALRGDPPVGQDTFEKVEGGFSYAVDLVRFIKENFGDYFGIAVAGYPEGHPDGNFEADLKYLKEKVDAGAELVITQLFYDVDRFLSFVKRAKEEGINVPIIPGIMPIHSYNGFMRMTGFCKTAIPQHILDALEPIKDDDAAVKAYGIKLGIQMCKQLLEGGVKGLHFYTLNLEKTVMSILEGLAMVEKVQRKMPWRTSAHPDRQDEQVRPIFWSNRHQSYHARTEAWDEYPNGRWGDSRSPAFGDLTNYHLVGITGGKMFHKEKDGVKVSIYPEVSDAHAVCDVFVGFLKGDYPVLPWVTTPMAEETRFISAPLYKLNQNGYLTINSQPRVNGTPSSDPMFGWGGHDGVVYQKAYLEFFCSKESLETLQTLLPKYKSLSYHAINVKGEECGETERTTAVTWGVFPNSEILQPTVVDPNAFRVWKDEAFALWKSLWGDKYPQDSKSRDVINSIHDSWYLINIVDNNFLNGDIFSIFNEAIMLRTVN
eukprot:TRINITY_DN1729_c2_g6_i2.p1 TRINITY_DN1729_c2_g6~~TRINITY_DN1729_c2_g6_i2.p1  ORF type:complete len:595 (+),score=196.83 TRINITY_DN1729_c2_g6_i2:46-1830(+)